MKKHQPEDQTVTVPRPVHQARLQTLLFTGAAFGTTLLLFGATAGPKLPPFVGE